MSNKKEISRLQNEYIKLAELAHETNKVLCRVRSFFPLQLFPDSIVVDNNKIDIVYRTFFWNKYVFTILHEDLTTIKISTGPFFATIFFEVKGYEINPEPVTFLPKNDAIKLHQTVIGLNKLVKNEVDTKRIPIEESSDNVKDIGKTNEDIYSAV